MACQAGDKNLNFKTECLDDRLVNFCRDYNGFSYDGCVDGFYRFIHTHC